MVSIGLFLKVKGVSPLGYAELMMPCFCDDSQLQKRFRRSLRELMRVTFFVKKVTKNTIAEFAVRPEGPDALRCSVLPGAKELASAAKRLPLRHLWPLFRQNFRSSAATRLIHVKVKTKFSGETQLTHE